MKNICKILAITVVLAMILAVGAMAAVPAGEYADGLVINDDGTFTMTQDGENTDGEGFALTVSGTVDEDGNFTITSLKDGDLELIDMASEDQLAGNLEALEAAFAGEASSEASGEASGDTSEAAYQEYLKSYVAACPAVSDEQYEEFAALIDAGNYTDFPVEMCFTDTYWGFVAATYDEFVAAGGNVELPEFDANLTADAEA